MDYYKDKQERMEKQIKTLYKNKEPCKHPGCLSHKSHPCEYCGRIEASGEVQVKMIL